MKKVLSALLTIALAITLILPGSAYAATRAEMTKVSVDATKKNAFQLTRPEIAELYKYYHDSIGLIEKTKYKDSIVNAGLSKYSGLSKTLATDAYLMSYHKSDTKVKKQIKTAYDAWYGDWKKQGKAYLVKQKDEQIDIVVKLIDKAFSKTASMLSKNTTKISDKEYATYQAAADDVMYYYQKLVLRDNWDTIKAHQAKMIKQYEEDSKKSNAQKEAEDEFLAVQIALSKELGYDEIVEYHMYYFVRDVIDVLELYNEYVSDYNSPNPTFTLATRADYLEAVSMKTQGSYNVWKRERLSMDNYGNLDIDLNVYTKQMDEFWDAASKVFFAKDPLNPSHADYDAMYKAFDVIFNYQDTFYTKEEQATIAKRHKGSRNSYIYPEPIKFN